MEMGCCGTVTTCFLIFCNCVLFIFAGAGVGIGAWTYHECDDSGADAWGDLIGYETTLGGIGMIVASGFLLIVTIVGCCGARSGSPSLLGVYFAVMLTLFFIFLSIAIVCLGFKDDILDEYADDLAYDIRYTYKVPGFQDKTDVIDTIQREFECCGLRGDYKGNSSWMYWQSSAWRGLYGIPSGNLVPESCCVKGANRTACQKSKIANSTQPPQPYRKSLKITEENAMLNGIGCIDALDDFVDEHFTAIGVLSAADCLFIILCVIASLYICQQYAKRSNNMI